MFNESEPEGEENVNYPVQTSTEKKYGARSFAEARVWKPSLRDPAATTEIQAELTSKNKRREKSKTKQRTWIQCTAPQIQDISGEDEAPAHEPSDAAALGHHETRAQAAWADMASESEPDAVMTAIQTKRKSVRSPDEMRNESKGQAEATEAEDDENTSCKLQETSKPDCASSNAACPDDQSKHNRWTGKQGNPWRI